MLLSSSTVSYTHLDVYKRQIYFLLLLLPYIPILYQEEGNNMRTKMPLLLSILSIPVSLVIKAIAFYNGLLFDGMF